MKAIDTIKLKGVVHYRVVDNVTGETLHDVTINNLVVNAGKGKVVHCITVTSSSNIINQIGAGTSSATPSLTDTTLTGATVLAIGAITYPTATSVQMAFTFGTGDANGITIQEFGLITGDSTLFSRITIAPIAKTSAISVIGTWNISL